MVPQPPTPPSCIRGHPNFSLSLLKPQCGLSPPAPLQSQHALPSTQSQGGNSWEDCPPPFLCPASLPSAQMTTFAVFLLSWLETHLEQLIPPSLVNFLIRHLGGRQDTKVWEQTVTLQSCRAPSTVWSPCKRTQRTSPYQKTQGLWQPLVSGFSSITLLRCLKHRKVSPLYKSTQQPAPSLISFAAAPPFPL